MNDNFLNNFKSWMEQDHQDAKSDSPIGKKVYPRINMDILEAIESDDDEQELYQDFKESGGVITDIEGKSFLVEVKSGTFYIHRRFCTKTP